MADMLTLKPENYDELALFLSGFENEVKNKDAWLDVFRLWWESNPAFSGDIERGWILVDGKKIVGFIGNIPSSFQLLGKKTTVFTISTWNVLPAYRAQSIDLLFKTMDAAGRSILFDTTPTEAVATILGSFGFSPLPGYQNKNSLIVINHGKFLRSKLADNIIGDVLSIALAPIIKMLQFFCERQLRRRGVRNVKEVSRADPAFDRLWERTKGLYANTNIRTAAMVQWYCFENRVNKKWLFGCYEGGELLGYLIAGSEASGNLRMLKCFDLWLDPSQDGVLESLVGFTARFAGQNSFDAAIFPHFTKKLGSRYNKLGMLRRRGKKIREYLKIGPECAAAISEGDSYFVELQGDRGMF